MRLATLRVGDHTVAVRVDDAAVVEIADAADVGALLRDPQWRVRAETAVGPAQALDGIEPRRWAPVVPRPGKVICVGLNYAAHIREMGRERPEYPTLFAKFPEAVTGPYDDIVVPGRLARALDWEGELAVVVGSPCFRVDRDTASACIAGYAVLNDVTMRDYQYRTAEWLQGKTLQASTPFGPFLVTPDVHSTSAEVRTTVDGEVMQSARIDDLVFDPADLIAYVSELVTLNPGDVIATGTPGGVGHARTPPRFLVDGSRLRTTIDGLGEQSNLVRIEG
ncbi:fumarylacetoacetate hydrolase family protein [Jiangella sp. DSM 45060]|uniref:fumarylacetoacetate hydrolase family protein n=1 Tax=Jiangella sp. DSM 45060 TaxID=1798224 RepID=UPI00087C8333|nr:fumarylacetoacetate hydrolase family protein [Jiangella sp. DSM 45060]SDT70878.1 acylpyruvate hydrolase [Jiangella sp. DSM 45060]